jgi:nucleoid DNA-binding protein
MATTKKSNAAKAASAKASPVKASPAKASPAPAGTESDEKDTTPVAPKDGRVKAPTLRIKDLIVHVAAATGGKRKDVKEMVEATLLALGEALSRGEDLNLPGFGRSRIARSAEKDGASMMTLKVRRGPHRPKAVKEPLADDVEDS